MVRPNQVIVKQFLDSIVNLVAQSSSEKYVLMILGRFVDTKRKTYPFLKNITIGLSGIRIDKKINDVNPKIVGKFLKIMVNTFFSHIFILLVKRKIPKILAQDLEQLGVIIND